MFQTYKQIITALRHNSSIEPHRKAVTAVQGDQERLRHFCGLHVTLKALWPSVFDLLVRRLSPEELPKITQLIMIKLAPRLCVFISSLFLHFWC